MIIKEIGPAAVGPLKLLQNNEMITTNNFYIDKTSFIKEWWEYNDIVTLITRPRRFGKTLNLDMVEHFFSVNYSGRSNLFHDLSIWQEENCRKLQGTYPVISLSFANVKETSFQSTKKRIYGGLSGHGFPECLI